LLSPAWLRWRSARAEGRVGSRRKKLDAAKRREIAESVITGRKSGAEMARLYCISQPTARGSWLNTESACLTPTGLLNNYVWQRALIRCRASDDVSRWFQLMG
jgi:hypothetical protein